MRLGAGGPLGSVRIADGRVVAVEVDKELGGPVLDMDGRTVPPGLWDAHVHAAQWAGNRHRVDPAGPASARAVAETVRLHAVHLPEDELVMGQGFRDGLWPDTPHKTLLDSVCPARAVALIGADLHAVWLNSACLALVGRGGHATGLLREHECFEALQALPEVPDEVLDERVAQACRDATGRGVTSVPPPSGPEGV